MNRLDGRPAAARAAVFTGRAAHLAAFSGLLASPADGTAGRALYLHGPAGIGKTALLERCAALARAEDRHVVRVDLSRPLDAELGALSGTRAPVVLLDDVDAFLGEAAELPRALAARLPADAVAVLAGRRAPHPSWWEQSACTGCWTSSRFSPSPPPRRGTPSPRWACPRPPVRRWPASRTGIRWR